MAIREKYQQARLMPIGFRRHYFMKGRRMLFCDDSLYYVASFR